MLKIYGQDLLEGNVELFAHLEGAMHDRVDCRNHPVEILIGGVLLVTLQCPRRRLHYPIGFAWAITVEMLDGGVEIPWAIHFEPENGSSMALLIDCPDSTSVDWDSGGER